MENEKLIRYFVAKCQKMEHLATARKTCAWACADRVGQAPHPREFLRDAFQDGVVVLIFSVSGCHGWQGYASMTSSPSEEFSASNSVPLDFEQQPSVPNQKQAANDPALNDSQHATLESSLLSEAIAATENAENLKTAGDTTPSPYDTRIEPCASLPSDAFTLDQNHDFDRDLESIQNQCSHSSSKAAAKSSTVQSSEQQCGTKVWHRFGIHWHAVCTDDTERCLGFHRTEQLGCRDGQTPANKARNLQELSADSGRELCRLIDAHYAALREERRRRNEEERRKAAMTAFLQVPISTEADVSPSPQRIWERLVGKVEVMGRVLLACAFGSQRYNLSVPSSDVDMFIVYAAPTAAVLSLTPPPQTIKNTANEEYDYTIVEVLRFCELLEGGDPKCVETLFLDPSCVYSTSPEFQRLIASSRCFLTRECVSKYLRDAQGSKGTKLLQKWIDSGLAAAPLPMDAKVAKLLYVIVRLLQNARDVARGEGLRVFRQEGSAERDLLMKIRTGLCALDTAQLEIRRLEAEIEALLAASEGEKGREQSDVKSILNDWLLHIRFDNTNLFLASSKSSADLDH